MLMARARCWLPSRPQMRRRNICTPVVLFCEENSFQVFFFLGVISNEVKVFLMQFSSEMTSNLMAKQMWSHFVEVMSKEMFLFHWEFNNCSKSDRIPLLDSATPTVSLQLLKIIPGIVKGDRLKYDMPLNCISSPIWWEISGLYPQEI